MCVDTLLMLAPLMCLGYVLWCMFRDKPCSKTIWVDLEQGNDLFPGCSSRLPKRSILAAILQANAGDEVRHVLNTKFKETDNDLVAYYPCRLYTELDIPQEYWK